MTPELLANIDVDDLARGTDFYCRMLQLTVARRLGPSVVELTGAGAKIYLIEKPAGSAANSAGTIRRDYARHWTPVHLDFVVPDIDAAIARAREAGAAPEGGIRTHKWGRIAALADPFGNGFCLIEFLNRGYDEIATASG